MAKPLKAIIGKDKRLDGVNKSSVEAGEVYGGKDSDINKNDPATVELVKKHTVQKHSDRVGNGEDIYNGTNVKYSMNDAVMKNFGRKREDAAKVYEAKEAEEAVCNHSPKGKPCPVHGMNECMEAKQIKEVAKTNAAHIRRMKKKDIRVNEPHSNFDMDTHKVTLTVSKDGNSEKIKHTLKAKDKHAAVAAAQREFHKKGYKVHDAVHKGILGEETLGERHLSPAELSKREEIAKAIAKNNPDMPMAKKMAIATAQAKKSVKEETQLGEGHYHVSWGPGVEHSVIAMNPMHAIEKAKAHITKKTPKLTEPKYADTFSKKPAVHKIKEAVEPLLQSADIAKYKTDDTQSEIDMVRTELKAIASKVMHMLANMPADHHIEPWVQSKIAAAKEMIGSVHDYMVYSEEEDEQADTPSVTPNMYPNMANDSAAGINV